MLLTQPLDVVQGGQVWTMVVDIHNALTGVGYGLIVLFCAMDVFQSAASFRDLRRPEFALRYLIRVAATKIAVGSGMEVMLAIFRICGGIANTVMGGAGGMAGAVAELDPTLQASILRAGFWDRIGLMAISLLGSLLIWAMSLLLIMTVYGRFFRLYMYTALAPIPLSTFAGRPTSRTGSAFIRSYTGVCMESAIIILACLIYSRFLSGYNVTVDANLDPASMVWDYIGQLIFNMLVLVGIVRSSDRVAKEMFGL